MEKHVNKAFDDVISVILESSCYQECLVLKEKMSKNKELMQLIEKLKVAQKEYVKRGYQDKREVESLEKQLQQIPIYVVYMEQLEKVNNILSYVEDDLNDYFFKLVNEKDYE